MLKLFPALLLVFVSPLSTQAARPGHEGGGENPCLSVSNTCGIVGFKGADIWKKCVEPLKQGKKVVSPDGTVVAPDVPDACKKAKAPSKEGKEGKEAGKDAAGGDSTTGAGGHHAHTRGGSVSSGDSGSGSSSSGGN